MDVKVSKTLNSGRGGRSDVCRVCSSIIRVPADGILACTTCRSGQLLSAGAEVARFEALGGVEQSSGQRIRFAMGHEGLGPRRLYIRARLKLRRLLWLGIEVKLEPW